MIVLYQLTSLPHPLGVTMTNDLALIKTSCLFRRLCSCVRPNNGNAYVKVFASESFIDGM